ncbi:MAG: cell envelope integrity protein TolA [Deltaproteobacteria bacterium]|nr:cell envelope integrity protein TolA [Deltaproteobacteria bacterium]
MASESNSFKTFVSLIASVTLHLAAIIIVALYANSHRPEPKAKVIMIATDLPMGNPQGPAHLTPGAKGSPGKSKTEQAASENQKQNSKNLETKTQQSQKSENISQDQKKEKAPDKAPKTEKTASSKQNQNNSSSPKSNSELKEPDAKKEKAISENQNNEKNSTQSGEASKQNEISAEEKARQEALANISNEIASRNNSSANNSASGGNNPSNSPGEGGAGGGGGPGSEVGARDSSYINYIVKVKNLIQRNWVRLGMESGKVLKAQINIKVDANGNVISKVMIRGSGSTSFDHSIKRAIESSTPLPPPPSSIRQDAMTDGIIIDFTGGSRSG